MWSVALFCFMLLWAEGKSNAQQCSPALQSSNFKFSVTSKRNKTGPWIAEISLSHAGGNDDNREWTIDVDHNTIKCQDSEMIQLIATATALPMKPSQGYNLIPGFGYYKFHETPLTWSGAMETCARGGSYLLILNSKEEYAEVKKMWDKYPNNAPEWRNNFLHVGLTDNVEEGQFYTLFGEHVNSTGYPNWAPNEPDSGNTANCAAVNKEGFLRDSGCSNQFAFVCEQF